MKKELIKSLTHEVGRTLRLVSEREKYENKELSEKTKELMRLIDVAKIKIIKEVKNV